MSYVNSIGGDPINPNPFTYSAISITGNITLGWPISGQSPTYSATDWIDVTSSAAYAVTMPDTTQVGIGTEVVFNNYGAFTITINDNAGSSITTIAAGFAKRIHIVTNATAAGTWRVVNIGAGTSSADASALAGYGLVALAGQLSQQFPVTSYNSNQTIAANSRAALAIWIGGAGTFTLTAPATLGANWFFNVRNSGSGTLTLDAGAALINGSSTLSAGVGEGFTVITDGANFYTIGKIAPTSSGLTLLNKSVAGAVDVTLTANESAFNIINFTGAITANINVIVPTAVRSWYFYNNTTGAFTVTVKTAAGTGLVVTQTARSILYCDGTNVVSPVSTTSGTVTSITAGTGLSGGTITGSGTIAIANTAVTGGSYGGAFGVATHTVNAQGQLTADSFTARSITGTANRITVTNGDGVAGAPTLDIASAYVGQNTITTLGSVATGTWAATVVGRAFGGTGLSVAGASGNVLTSDGTNWVSSAPSISVTSQSTPSDPTGTANTTGLMMGLAASITPLITGKILVIISGDGYNANSPDGGECGLRYNTGSAPANAAAITGNSGAPLRGYTVGNSGGPVPFSINTIISGLTLNTAYWVDLSLASINGNLASIKKISISIIEL